jgi:hypothetical protein
VKRSPFTTAGILILVVLQNPDGTVGNMTLNTTAAAGPELEPEPATRAHQMNERREAIAIVVSCTCGWTRKILRRQNALARASKVRSAWAEHQREIEAERIAASLR